MELTIKLLLALGFEEQEIKPQYGQRHECSSERNLLVSHIFILKSQGTRYYLLRANGGWWFGDEPLDDGGWDCMGHAITHVEEMIGFAYHDGLKDGANELRKELAELMKPVD